MTWLEALFLGLIQGVTEFLPISSSGHLELFKVLLHINSKDNLTFDIIVHAATVCSTLVVFRKDIYKLLYGTLKIKYNAETDYVSKLLISAIPVIFVGLFLEDLVERFFNGNTVFIGSMLCLTACLLAFTYFTKQKQKSITFLDAFLIGISQAVAVLPGLSRSGATIATALILKNQKEEAARFAFLMVIIPILGKLLIDVMDGSVMKTSIELLPLALGFSSAFLTGFFACKLMVALVKKSKLYYFAIYCALIGILSIVLGLL